MAALRGHAVTLYEKKGTLGGQFNLAKSIPGKGEFQGTIAYFQDALQRNGVHIHLNIEVDWKALLDYDEVIIATGIRPRVPDINGIDHASVMTYIDCITGTRKIGTKIAIIGAGGIGFDVAEFLLGSERPEMFYEEWGIDRSLSHRGGLVPPILHHSGRTIYLLQRKKEKVGKRLSKTTGWIKRARLLHHGVHMLNDLSYHRIDDAGLHIIQDNQHKTLSVDSIIVCAGQEEYRAYERELNAAGVRPHIIGGAYKALELDAKTAIEQACRLGAEI